MAGPLSRRRAAESVGTALLIVSGPGAVVAALTVGKSLDYAALSVVGLSFGLVVAIVIYAFGTMPGAHIHPAMTVWPAGSCQAVSSAACSSSGPPSVPKPWPACSVGPSPGPSSRPHRGVHARRYRRGAQPGPHRPRDAEEVDEQAQGTQGDVVGSHE